MLASIFYGAMYGGSTTSILLNIPGEAASVVTCIDGHQMARQGRAGAALGIAAHRLVRRRHARRHRHDVLRAGDRGGRDPVRAAREFRADGARRRLHAVHDHRLAGEGRADDGARLPDGGDRHRRGQRARALHLRLGQPVRRDRTPGGRHRAVRSDRGAEQRRTGCEKHASSPSASATCGRRSPTGGRRGGRCCAAAGSDSCWGWFPAAGR